MTVERYARGWAELAGVECHPGLEIRDGDDVEDLTVYVQTYAANALSLHGGNHTAVAEYVERNFQLDYPGRAYFIETEEDGRGVHIVSYGAFGRGHE